MTFRDGGQESNWLCWNNLRFNISARQLSDEKQGFIGRNTAANDKKEPFLVHSSMI